MKKLIAAVMITCATMAVFADWAGNQRYADAQNIPWLDYNTLLNDGEGGMGDKADDGLHPNAKGYAIMEAALVPFLKKVGN